MVGQLQSHTLPVNEPQSFSTLKRLVFSFERGLLFDIGKSLSTGKANAITYSSIHLKSRQVGGTASHGWPDPNCFVNVGGETDSKGVPMDPTLGVALNFFVVTGRRGRR